MKFCRNMKCDSTRQVCSLFLCPQLMLCSTLIHCQKKCVADNLFVLKFLQEMFFPCRFDSLSNRRRTSVGIEAAWCPFASCLTEHPDLLQHQILHAENARRTFTTVIQSHHETLEENEFAGKQDSRTKCLLALLCTGT